jgi:hypothetical protein
MNVDNRIGNCLVLMNFDNLMGQAVSRRDERIPRFD